MKKFLLLIYIFVLFILNIDFTLAATSLSNNTPIHWTILESSYPQWWLNIEKIVFPNTTDWVKVDASTLVNNPNSDLSIKWNFWIQSVSESWIDASGWATFDHGINWYKAVLKNNLDNTFYLEWLAWSQNAGWIFFWNTWVSGWRVVYDRNTWKFYWSARSENLWWLPMDWLTLVTSAPNITWISSPSSWNYIFEAEQNKNLSINWASTWIINITLNTVDWVMSYTWTWPTLNVSWNYSLVGPYPYTISDEYWNSTNWSIAVVANIPDSSKSPIVFSPNTLKKADWNDKHNFSINLFDKYENPVVNIPWLKTVEVKITFNNDVDNNQVINNNSWDAISISWDFNNTSVSTASKSVNNYNFSLTSLAPTKIWYSKTSINNDINIAKLEYKVTANSWYNNIWETSWFINRINPWLNDPFAFYPAIDISDITTTDNKIIRDTEAEFNISTLTNFSWISNISILNKLDIANNILMTYKFLDSSQSKICSGYRSSSTQYFESATWKWCEINSNKSSKLLLYFSTLVTNYSFKATPKIILAADPIFPTDYKSEINYEILWESISYPSTSKNLNNIVSNNQIKVAWLANKWNNEILIDSSNKFLNNNISRANLRKQIAKNVEYIIKNWVKSNVELRTSDYTIDKWPVWVDTIIVKWADLIITWDLYKNNPEIINSIVVLKEWNNGWNIWIENTVKFISSIIYTDWLIISGEKSTNKYYSDTSGWAINQLFIKWSIFSLNTIWGASTNPLKCPYFVNSSSCDENTAKRYDLNHLRHYVNDNNSHWTAFLSGEYWKDNINMNKVWYTDAPTIIEYDALIQSNPSQVFKLTK